MNLVLSKMKFKSVEFCYIFVGFIAIAGGTLFEDHLVSFFLFISSTTCYYAICDREKIILIVAFSVFPKVKKRLGKKPEKKCG